MLETQAMSSLDGSIADEAGTVPDGTTASEIDKEVSDELEASGNAPEEDIFLWSVS